MYVCVFYLLSCQCTLVFCLFLCVCVCVTERERERESSVYTSLLFVCRTVVRGHAAFRGLQLQEVLIFSLCAI